MFPVRRFQTLLVLIGLSLWLVACASEPLVKHIGIEDSNTPCETCGDAHVIGVITEEVQTGEGAGNTLVRVVSFEESGEWYVDITPDTAITYEDWSAAPIDVIAPDTMVDVVGPLWSPGYIAAQYVIVLDPATNPIPAAEFGAYP
jgi:hypothetical protein